MMNRIQKLLDLIAKGMICGNTINANGGGVYVKVL